MARTREFDPQTALEQAMQLFWSQGYEATSLADLLVATGLSKSSLYDVFKSKHALFLAALERYEASVMAEMATRLNEARLPRAAVVALLVTAANNSLYRDQRGCLMANVAMERGPRDPEARERIAGAFARLEDAVYRALYRAREAGDIDAGRDIRALAAFVIATLNGLRVAAKITPDRLHLNAAVQAALVALG
jgi:TetR/AcrR family transcriptional repressor of nem operon